VGALDRRNQLVNMKQIIFAILLVCSTARAQVWMGGTNEKSGITGPLIYTNFVAGQFRVTVGALDGGSPIDLSGDRVSLQVQDTRDGKLVVSNTCVTIDAYTYRGEGSLSASPAPYTLRVQVYPAANPDAYYPIYWASLTITSAPSASGGGSVSVSVTTTANLTVASSGTGNVVTGLTANGSVVTEHRGTVAGGSGGGPTIYGAASNTFGVATSLQFSSRFSLSGTTNGGVLVDYTTPILPDWSIGTNVVSYGTIGTQLVTFAAGVSNASLEMWSGASCSSASGGSGSYGKLYLRGDLESIQLMLYIPQGGEGTLLAPPYTGFVYQTSSAFPGGGRGAGYVAGASFFSVPSGSGGYAAAFIIDGSGTNLVMIVPAGAGSASLSTVSLGGDGGNELSGEDASLLTGAFGGYGATSSSNGYYFTFGNLMATGSPPAQFIGGGASLTNLPASHLAAGGGSPGWFSGSGGFITGVNGRSGGGSGVGWINRTNAYVLAGDIFGGENGVPVGIDSRGYVAGWAYPLATPATYPLTSRAGQGGAVVKW
jgi:hypothetical protein